MPQQDDISETEMSRGLSSTGSVGEKGIGNLLRDNNETVNPLSNSTEVNSYDARFEKRMNDESFEDISSYLWPISTLFMMAGIVPKSKWSKYFATFHNGCMYFTILFGLINATRKAINDDSIERVVFTNFFCYYLNAALVYSIVLNDVFFNDKPDIFQVINEIYNSDKNRSSSPRKIVYLLSLVLMCIIVFLVVFSIVAASFSPDYLYQSVFLNEERSTKNMIFLVFSLYLVYFVAFGWLFPLLYVCLPAVSLALRIQQYIEYLESTNSSVVDWTSRMEWYDDLYSGNTKLVTLVSSIITVNLALLCPLVVFLLEAVAKGDGVTTSADRSAYGYWIGINTGLIFLEGGSVALLSALNRRLEMAMGSVSAKVQLDERHSQKFLVTMLKIKAIPFGVTFFGTRIFITFEIMITAITAVLSVFLFIYDRS